MGYWENVGMQDAQRGPAGGLEQRRDPDEQPLPDGGGLMLSAPVPVHGQRWDAEGTLHAWYELKYKL